MVMGLDYREKEWDRESCKMKAGLSKSWEPFRGLSSSGSENRWQGGGSSG